MPNLKLFLLVFISAAYFCQPVYSQLKISGGAGYLVHLSGVAKEDEMYDYFKTKKYQDISHYFGDDYSYSASVSYRYSPFKKDTLFSFFAGLEYMNAVTHSTRVDGGFILGEELTINSYSPFIGGGYIPRLGDRNIFIYLFGGISVKQYQGTSDYGDIQVEQNYKSEIVPHIGFGVEYIPTRKFPVAFALEASMDIGYADRRNVTAYYQGIKAAEFRPTGQISLADNSFFYKLTVGYLINL